MILYCGWFQQEILTFNYPRLNGLPATMKLSGPPVTGGVLIPPLEKIERLNNALKISNNRRVVSLGLKTLDNIKIV